MRKPPVSAPGTESAIRGYLINSLGCAGHEADDIVQDTALVIGNRWDHVRTLGKPAAYWFKIAGRRFHRVQGRRAQRRAAAGPP